MKFPNKKRYILHAHFRALWRTNPSKALMVFVANEILEKKDLSEAVRSISDLLKTIHGMESDAAGYRESYIMRWIDFNMWEYIDARRC